MSERLNVVLQCKDCGAIMVVAPKDLWNFIRCTQCDSKNVVNITEENKDGKFTKRM